MEDPEGLPSMKDPSPVDDLKLKLLPATGTKRKKKGKYSIIGDEKRLKLIDLVVNEDQHPKLVAQKLQINYSTARAILKTFQTEGRVGKKKIRKKYESRGREPTLFEEAFCMARVDRQDAGALRSQDRRENVCPWRFIKRHKFSNISRRELPCICVRLSDVQLFIQSSEPNPSILTFDELF
eukprot:TRINITY_DN3119_c0_g1_i9.p1 TRINITY_DN3119_c0_g1~~TRINITY_DN3119_c0_g1_i9.p1  ORF type:complete len:181 (+),score=25.37 TRINITY_DN3119_c0_g1_i9:205-747(+)